MPEIWGNPPAEALQAGHGGGDYFEEGQYIHELKAFNEITKWRQ